MDSGIFMFKDELNKLTSYSPSHRFGDGKYPICIDWNEGPFDLPKDLQILLMEHVKRHGLNRYPGISEHSVERRLVASLGVASGSVALYNGSDSALQELLSCLVWNGRRVFYVEPEYSQSYQFAQLYGGDLNLVRPEDVFSKYDTVAGLGLTELDVLYLSNPC